MNVFVSELSILFSFYEMDQNIFGEESPEDTPNVSIFDTVPFVVLCIFTVVLWQRSELYSEV